MERKRSIPAAFITLAIASIMITSFAAGGASAATAPPACKGVIVIDGLRWVPATVHPGASSTAVLTARNCTKQTRNVTLTWLGRFAGSGSGIPAGCPAIDPLAKQVTFAPLATVHQKLSFMIFPGCTATSLVETARLTAASGKVLASRSATLHITPASG